MYEQSKWFFREFCRTFDRDSPCRPGAVAAYAHNTDFTSFITKRINEIIASKGYAAQNEYYRIDTMGYTSHWQSLPASPSLNRHLWDLEIAVEHENDPKDWLDEVIKLAHVCCPLRVVIGYVPMDQRGCGDLERLAYVTTALKRLKCRENLTSGEFLVILGNCRTNGNPAHFFHYKAYVLNRQTLDFESLDQFC